MYQNMCKENIEKYYIEHHKLLLHYLQAKPKKHGEKKNLFWIPSYL